MTTALSTERLERLRALARTLIEDYGLKGRWRWDGHADGQRPNLHLATQQHGRTYVMGFARAGMTEGQPLFPVRPGDSAWSRMRKAAEIPVFEVCRDATSRDDPRVYRTDVVNFRSPAAEWLAEVDAETVLALVDCWLEHNGGLPAEAAGDDSAELVDVVADLGDYVEPSAEVAR